ncbi:hypothetical protein LIER_08337 [Lithospermum erythrorhizon]|uniref:Uncharacterized protein n=1 Tax=Lithospermum erythrorhizon TaxID=34254 RepID=A0AAV3PBP6_LITER
MEWVWVRACWKSGSSRGRCGASHVGQAGLEDRSLVVGVELVEVCCGAWPWARLLFCFGGSSLYGARSFLGRVGDAFGVDGGWSLAWVGKGLTSDCRKRGRRRGCKQSLMVFSRRNNGIRRGYKRIELWTTTFKGRGWLHILFSGHNGCRRRIRAQQSRG